MRGLSQWGGVLLLVLIGPMLGAAWILDTYMGRDVRIITPATPEVVTLNRELWEHGEPVAEIYGIPQEELIRVLFVDESLMITPQEDPSLALFPVDKQAGENPLQVKTVWFVAKRGSIGLLLAGVSALSLTAILRRRERSSSLNPSF